jgi:glycosyltransferase involved in cell wall biosynthesis
VEQEIIIGIAIALYVAMTIMVVANRVYLMRRRAGRPSGEPLVSILIPARNEAPSLRRLLPALASQTYDRMEVIVYDDESTDTTWEVIQQHQGGRISGIRGGPLPNGWVGKCYALDQAAAKATGDILLFLDADAIVSHDGVLDRLVAEFESLPPFSVLTVLPGLNPSGGRVLVSLIPHAMLLVIPWFLIPRVRIPAFSALNGQCWMIDAEDYRSFTPHRERRAEILEDVRIGQDLARAGMHIHLLATKGDLDVRMYESIGEAWRGFRRSTYPFLGGSPLRFTLLLILFLFTFIAAPVMAPLLLVWALLLKWETDRITGFKAVITVLFPVSYLFGLVACWDSAWHHWRGHLKWKGRTLLGDR